jgi:hypothetical protein
MWETTIKIKINILVNHKIKDRTKMEDTRVICPLKSLNLDRELVVCANTTRI